MLMILVWLVVFIFSIIVLVRSSDWFTEAAEKIGLWFGLSPFVIGVTIVAFGTSLPELVSSLFAVSSGATEIVSGNVIGSNIANILLILGITVIVANNIKIKHTLIRIDLPILAASAFILALTVYDGVFDFFDAIIALSGMVIYLVYLVKNTKRSHKKDDAKPSVSPIVFVVLVLSGLGIFLGAKFVVDSVLELSKIIGIGTEVIAVVAVAFGTSLPELAVSISAARKGRAEMAVGNLLGSNIFNTFLVMGLPALFAVAVGGAGLIIPASLIYFGLPVMLVASFLFLLMMQDGKLSRWEGWFFVLLYVFFVGRTIFFA